MPVVGERRGGGPAASPAGALFSRCGNPRCATGWIRLWRNRRVPRFEGKWACAAECMAELVGGALARESMEPGAPAGVYSHRVPLGLMLVEQGVISREELRRGLEGQRRVAEETGERVRLGEWLVESGLIGEEVLARVLGAQWGSPVVHLGGFRAAQTAAVLPPLLAEALSAIPAGAAAGGRIYLAFANGVDRSLSYAVERMNGLPVTAAVALDSDFRRAQAAWREAAAPKSRFLEAAGAGELKRAVTRLIEAEKPVEARLVRVHGWYWLRLWRRIPAAGLSSPEEVEDTIGVIGPIDRGRI